MTQARPDRGTDALATHEDAACWLAAKRLRQQRPAWVVIWIARIGSYRAYPLFRAPRGTVLTAETPEQLAAQMDQAEQIPLRSQARFRNPDNAR